jgi:hypothetical protein
MDFKGCMGVNIKGGPTVLDHFLRLVQKPGR